MKRFEKSKRVLAFLLVALMVVQQSSVTILADEQSADIHNVQNQEETSTEEKTGETRKTKMSKRHQTNSLKKKKMLWLQ